MPEQLRKLRLENWRGGLAVVVGDGKRNRKGGLLYGRELL